MPAAGAERADSGESSSEADAETLDVDQILAEAGVSSASSEADSTPPVVAPSPGKRHLAALQPQAVSSGGSSASSESPPGASGRAACLSRGSSESSGERGGAAADGPPASASASSRQSGALQRCGYGERPGPSGVEAAAAPGSRPRTLSSASSAGAAAGAGRGDVAASGPAIGRQPETCPTTQQLLDVFVPWTEKCAAQQLSPEQPREVLPDRPGSTEIDLELTSPEGALDASAGSPPEAEAPPVAEPADSRATSPHRPVSLNSHAPEPSADAVLRRSPLQMGKLRRPPGRASIARDAAIPLEEMLPSRGSAAQARLRSRGGAGSTSQPTSSPPIARADAPSQQPAAPADTASVRDSSSGPDFNVDDSDTESAGPAAPPPEEAARRSRCPPDAPPAGAHRGTLGGRPRGRTGAQQPARQTPASSWRRCSSSSNAASERGRADLRDWDPGGPAGGRAGHPADMSGLWVPRAPPP
ncbi:unnamed protein product, partial [Prorocentrum cordatum]